MPIETLDFQMNFEANEQSEADKKLLVIFYKDAIKNEIKSAEAGRPIFDEVDLVKIIAPGSRDSFVGDATPDYQARFPTQWAKYKAGKTQSMSGSPLSVLPWLSVAQIAEFNALSCYTVEQLVGMPDAVAHKFMGFNAIKERASAWLKASSDAAPLMKMEAELKKRDEQIEQMQATMAAMSSQLQKLAPAVSK